MTDPRTSYWCLDCEANVGIRRIKLTLQQIPLHPQSGPPAILPTSARRLTVVGACGHTGNIIATEETIVRIRDKREAA